MQASLQPEPDVSGIWLSIWVLWMSRVKIVRFLRILLASSLELVLDAVSGMEDETASSTVGFASSPSCG